MDALSWISLAVIAPMALAVAAVWLRRKLVGHGHGVHAHASGYGVGALLLACLVLLAVEGLTDTGIKETVFDGWVDSVADAVDGTDDREEALARRREGSGRGFMLAA